MDEFRRTLGISRKDRIRNDDVRQQMGVDGSPTTKYKHGKETTNMVRACAKNGWNKIAEKSNSMDTT